MKTKDVAALFARKIVAEVVAGWKPGDSAEKVQRRVAALLEEAIENRLGDPETEDFCKGVLLEAAHQRDRWKESDPTKTPADWFWLLGWLGGKAVHDPHEPWDERTARERRLHRIIATAAAAANWHAQELKGKP